MHEQFDPSSECFEVDQRQLGSRLRIVIVLHPPFHFVPFIRGEFDSVIVSRLNPNSRLSNLRAEVKVPIEWLCLYQCNGMTDCKISIV